MPMFLLSAFVQWFQTRWAHSCAWMGVTMDCWFSHFSDWIISELLPLNFVNHLMNGSIPISIRCRKDLMTTSERANKAAFHWFSIGNIWDEKPYLVVFVHFPPPVHVRDTAHLEGFWCETCVVCNTVTDYIDGVANLGGRIALNIIGWLLKGFCSHSWWGGCGLVLILQNMEKLNRFCYIVWSLLTSSCPEVCFTACKQQIQQKNSEGKAKLHVKKIL